MRSAWQRALVDLHRLVRRDRRYRIGGFDVRLPPGHKLPWFQAVFPTYDSYAGPLLAALCAPFARPVLVDVGANVGDTALLAVSAVDGIRVVAVEGDDNFLRYLTSNVRPVADQVQIVPAFVTPVSAGPLQYATDGSTGGFRSCADRPAALDGLAVSQLLELADGDLAVWKSDTDGMDVTILLDGWDLIDRRCAVVWFELDPALDIDRGRHIPELLTRIAASGRTCLVFDNMGGYATTLGPGELDHELSTLLTTRRERGAVYYDVWAFDTSRVPVPVSAIRSVG